MAHRFAHLLELVQHQILNEVRLHVIEYRYPAVDVVVYLVVPCHHRAHGGLIGVCLQEVIYSLFGLAQQHGCLVVVLRGCLERRVGITYQTAVLFQWQHLAIADMFAEEHRPFVDGVVHILFLETTLTHVGTQFHNLLPAVFLRPRGLAGCVDGVDHRMVCFRALGETAQDTVLADPVPYQYKPPAPHIHRAEQSREAPVESLRHTRLVAYHLVVVDIIDYDIVRTLATVLDSTRRLTTTQRHEVHSVGGLELAGTPAAFVDLDVEIGFQQRIELQFTLQVREQAVGTVFRLRYKDHHMDGTPLLDHQPDRYH